MAHIAHKAAAAANSWWSPRIQVTAKTRQKVEEMAIAERRSLSMMLAILVEEAVALRESED